MPTDAHDAGSLRRSTVRGAVASTAAQAANIVLRTASIIVLSRLLLPHDFGLVAMVTAVTGFLALFRDLGLSTASVQRADVTEDQISALFWVNLLVGALLAAACSAIAPLVVWFYDEPRLFQIALAVAAGFLLNGAGVQHRALLRRRMMFGALAVIDTAALMVAIGISISMARAGYGYWAVVMNAILPQVIGAIGVVAWARWLPDPPKRNSGIGPLLKFGGTLTLNGLVVNLAYNADKILLGRFWGADALGTYSRAYQLISLPVDGLNAAISQVALPALARVQNDAERLRHHFLRGYGVFLTVMVPLTVACAVFSSDIVRVLLGEKWADAVPVFTRLSPTMLVLAIINPLSWLMLATGRATRSLCIALLIAPTVIVGYSLGLPSGPSGVAVGFSAAMLLLAAPVVIWSRQGTQVTGRDIARELMPVLVAAVIAGVVAFASSVYTSVLQSPVVRLTVNTSVLFGVFAVMMLFTMKDKSVYLKMLSDLNPHWRLSDRLQIRRLFQ